MTIEAQIAGTLESLCLTPTERAVAADLLRSIAASIARHLTPANVSLLASRGVTVDDAIEHLARRALEAVIAEGQARR